MQQRLNVRLSLWLIGITFVVALGVCAVHEFQMRRNVSAYLRQAEYALADGDLPRADRYLDSYLSYNLVSINSLAQVGLKLEARARTPKEYALAFEIFERVLRKKPDRTDVRYRLIWAALALHRLEDAEKQCRLLLPAWPNKAELHHIIAWCQNAAGDYEQAVASFARATAADAQRIDAYLLQADILNDRLRRAEDAENVLNQLIAANPKSHRSYLGRARFFQQHGKLEEAGKDIDIASSLAPTDASVLLTAAQIAQARGDIPAARGLAGKGLVEHPTNAQFYKTLAGLELRAGKRPAAIEAIQRGLKAAPNDSELLTALADLLVEDNRLAEAKVVLSSLRQETPAARYLAAGIAFGEQRWRDAINILEKLRTDLHGSSDLVGRVNTLLGLSYGRIHAPEQRVVALERAVAQDPDLVAARRELAVAFIEDGRFDQAISILEDIRKRPDAPKNTLLLLARARIMRQLTSGKHDGWDTLATLLDEVGRIMPDAPELVILRAEVLAAQHKYPEARTLLASSLDADRKNVLLWSARADLEGRQRRFEDGLHLLDEAGKLNGDQVPLRLARARLLAAKGDAESRKALALLAEKLDGFSKDDQVRLLRSLAELQQVRGDLQVARAIWHKLAAREPRDLHSRQKLVDIALADNQLPEARRLLDDIRKIEGENGIFYLYGKAALAVQQAAVQPVNEAKLIEAKSYLLELDRRRPDWSRLPLLQGRIAELEADAETASNRYLEALERGERQPEFVLKLLRMLCEHGRYVAAETTLRGLEEQMPLSPQLSRLGAEIALGNHDPVRAVARSKQAVKSNTNDYRDLLWLAGILARAGNHKDAESVLRRAVDVGGHVPETWVALARQLARSKQIPEAAPLFERMKKELPASLVDTTAARCHQALGDLDNAAAIFDKALQVQPRDFSTLALAAEFYLGAQSDDQAEACLRKLLAESIVGPGDQKAWARRELAVLLAERGRTQEALGLLQTNKQLAGDTLADQRARLYVEGTQTKLRAAAIRALEQSFERAAATEQERFRLARLYDLSGLTDRGRKVTLDLLLANPEDGSLLAHTVRRLLAQDQLADAQLYFNRLERLEPKSARTRQLQSELLQAKSIPLVGS